MTETAPIISPEERGLAACTHLAGLAGYVIPLGGVIVRRPLLETIWESEVALYNHGSTFGGHPVSTAVAVANMQAMVQAAADDILTISGERIGQEVRRMLAPPSRATALEWLYDSINEVKVGTTTREIASSN